MFSRTYPSDEPKISGGDTEGILLRDISLRFPDPVTPVQALKGIDLILKKDEFICVLGPSGCGKSSLLNIIAGYLMPTTGTIQIDGLDHIKPDAKVGVVFQHANLFPWLSIAKNNEFGLKMIKVPSAERKSKVAHYLELVGLEKYAALKPHQLSGGMKQRAAIARTLAIDPSIILLDEPFGALDALTRELMQKHIRDIWRKTRKCLFFITHDVEEALLLSRRIVVMHPNPGRIVKDFENPLFRESNDQSFEQLRSSREFSELRTFLVSQIASHH